MILEIFGNFGGWSGIQASEGQLLGFRALGLGFRGLGFRRFGDLGYLELFSGLRV